MSRQVPVALFRYGEIRTTLSVGDGVVLLDADFVQSDLVSERLGLKEVVDISDQ
jgi:hypothetical protein